MFFEWTRGREEDSPQKKKGWLRQAFDVARTYAMPLSLNIEKKGGEWGVVLNSRKSVYNFVKVGLTNIALNTALWFSFPNAEQYCEKNDIDPAMASALTDTSVRVVPHNFLRKAFYLTQNPLPALGMAQELNGKHDDQNTYFVRFMKTGWFFWDSYMASLPGKDFTDIDMIKNVVPVSYLENLPATEQEMKTLITAHELAHTHSSRALGGIFRGFNASVVEETMADLNGAGEAAKVTGNDQLPILWSHRRALDIFPHDPHNNALYLDAERNGTPYPDIAEMVEANQEFFKALKKYFPKLPEELTGEEKFKDFYISLAVTTKALLEMESLDLSPLARRRAELVLEAVQYFTPTIYEVIKEPTVTITAPKEPEKSFAERGFSALQPPAPTQSL